MIIPLERRRTCVTNSFGQVRCQSSWNWFGRWIFVSLMILFFFIILGVFFRRRKMSRRVIPTHPPTGWAGQPMQSTNPTGQQPYAPPTGPPPAQHYYQQNGADISTKPPVQSDLHNHQPPPAYMGPSVEMPPIPTHPTQ